MLHRAISACAVLLLLVSSSQAKPKLVFTGKCLCTCLLTNTSGDVVYSNQLSCVPLEDKTCNVEVNGLIRSGSVEYCEKIMRKVDVRRLPRTEVEPSR